MNLSAVWNPLRLSVLVAVLGCVTACKSTQPALTITLRESTIPYDPKVGPVDVNVTVVARNHGRVPIWFSSRCVWETQRLIGKEWTRVNGPVCPAIDSYSPLAPGDSTVFPIRVSDPTTGARDADPRITERVYRLLFGIGVGANPSDHPQDPSIFKSVASTPVTVKE